MTTRPIKPHQQAILDAFDAGEKNCAELARRFSYERTSINVLLRRYGRQPRTIAEARAVEGRGKWSPLRRRLISEALREAHARADAAEGVSATSTEDSGQIAAADGASS